MNPFWENLYDAVKDRRYGMLFFTILLGTIGLFVLGLFIAAETDLNVPRLVGVPVLSGVGVFFLTFTWVTIRRARKRRRERWKFAALSRDEMEKARSKLVKSKLKFNKR